MCFWHCGKSLKSFGAVSIRRLIDYNYYVTLATNGCRLKIDIVELQLENISSVFLEIQMQIYISTAHESVNNSLNHCMWKMADKG